VFAKASKRSDLHHTDSGYIRLDMSSLRTSQRTPCLIRPIRGWNVYVQYWWRN